jgi:flagellin
MGITDNILVRMRELAEQASTGSYSAEQKAIMQQEFVQLANEVTRIANNTKFNGNNLLDTDATGAMVISLGAGAGSDAQVIKIDTHDVTAEGLGTTGTKESMVVSHWVQDPNATYIQNGDTDPHSLDLFIDGTEEFTVDLAAGAGISLNNLVTQINTQAGAQVAQAVYSSATDQWSLKVAATESGNLTNIDLGEDGVSGTYTNLEWGNGASVVAADLTQTDGNGTGTMLADVDISVDAAAAIEVLDAAIKEKDNYRAHLGYMMNRLEAAASVIDIQAENLAAAESRISDVDVATEMAAMTRSQVLAQAGVSMLSQANSMPQMAMQLLRG